MTEAEANELAADIVYRLHKAAQNENIMIPLVVSDGLYLDVKAALLAASRPPDGYIRTREGEDLRVIRRKQEKRAGGVGGTHWTGRDTFLVEVVPSPASAAKGESK